MDAATEAQLTNILARLQDLELRHNEFKGTLKDVRYVAPTRPREGDFVFADGTTWDPGSGRGLYQYVSGAWVKL